MRWQGVIAYRPTDQTDGITAGNGRLSHGNDTGRCVRTHRAGRPVSPDEAPRTAPRRGNPA